MSDWQRVCLRLSENWPTSDSNRQCKNLKSQRNNKYTAHDISKDVGITLLYVQFIS